VLAHQGGWDEALMVIVPVGLFVGLLWAATRRAASAEARAEAGAAPAERPRAEGSERGALHPAEPHGHR
jgi:hypothetical protein